MQCEFCQSREATIHLTEINDGVRTETHMCEQCAQEHGVGSKNYIPLNELLSNLLAAGPKEEEAAMPGESEGPVCPRCGWTLDNLQEKGVLGCPYDYEAFEEQLKPLIKKAHEGAVAHCGKIPTRTPKESKREIEITQLRRRLDEAVRNEDYELAAKLRDKLAGK